MPNLTQQFKLTPTVMVFICVGILISAVLTVLFYYLCKNCIRYARQNKYLHLFWLNIILIAVPTIYFTVANMLHSEILQSVWIQMIAGIVFLIPVPLTFIKCRFKYGLGINVIQYSLGLLLAASVISIAVLIIFFIFIILFAVSLNSDGSAQTFEAITSDGKLVRLHHLHGDVYADYYNNRYTRIGNTYYEQ